MNNYLKVYLIPSLTILVCVIGILFYVKNKVFVATKDLRYLNTKIHKEQEMLHVLKAEFSFLSNPKRIKKLSEKNLHLKQITKSNILHLNQLDNYIKETTAVQ